MYAAHHLSPSMQNALSASAAGDSASALEWLFKASEEQPASGLPYFLMGSEYAAMGDIHRAEEAFSNAVVLAPNFSIARYQLGFLQFTAGRPAVALVTWQPLLNLEDESPLPHWILGFAALAQDRFDAALVHFEAGLARNTENPPMSADIRKIIAGMADLAPLAKGEAACNTTGDQPQEEELEANHFLLSAYQQNRTTH